MMRRSVVVTLLMCAAVVVGCAGDRAEPVAGSEDPASSPAVAESCLAGATDCDDTPTTSPRGAPQGDEGGAIDEAAVIADAESLLGQAEEDALSRSDVRLERHGDEQMALTEDYVIGRMTIETDDDGTGIYRVVAVSVELTDGPLAVTDEG